MNNSRLVYSTETGRICPLCNKPISKCICKNKKSKSHIDNKIDGTIRIKREVKGRKGKTVTTIAGLAHNENKLKELAKQLKSRCGAGGAVKNGIIIIQGDHREKLQSELEKEGYKTKLAGG
jgi:translation initiation factor 1